MYDYYQLIELTERTNEKIDTLSESVDNLCLVNCSILLALLVFILLSIFRS